MKTLIFHGYLKDLHPEPLRVAATSVAEAVSALQLIPAFQLAPGEKHSVAIDGFASRDALYDRTDVEEIHIRPVMAGAGRGALQIVIGIVLIVGALASGGALIAASGALTATGSIALAGAMMVLGGILQMLSPQPTVSKEDEKSRYLGQGRNTVAIGTRIPLLYGKHKAFGHYLSFDIDAGDLNKAPEAWYSSPYTDYGSTTYSAAPATLPQEEPAVFDNQPLAAFASVTTVGAETYINFSPSVNLDLGQWDVNFNTGQTLHVNNVTAGGTTQVVVLGGSVSNLPPAGTGIVFTRNYG